MNKRRHLRKFLVLAYASLFSCFLLEVGLHVALPGPQFDTRLPYFPNMHETYPIDLHGVSANSVRTTNEWGFRGDDPPENWDDTYTIVAVGGSTTRVSYLDDDLTWPALLQATLREFDENIWVGNAGIAGQSTRGHILVMEEVISEIRPDVVILLVGTNDLGLSMTEEFRLNGSPGDRRRPLLKYWLDQSRFYQFLDRNYQAYLAGALTERSAHRNFVPETIDPAFETRLPDNLIEALPQLPEFRDNLARIIEIAHSIDAEVLILTQPSLYADGEQWERVRGSSYFIRNERYDLSAANRWRLLELYNHATLEVCEEQNVACYDLAAQVPHTMHYFFDSVHFTEAGAALVAEHTARAVREELWPSAERPPR